VAILQPADLVAGDPEVAVPVPVDLVASETEAVVRVPVELVAGEDEVVVLLRPVADRLEPLVREVSWPPADRVVSASLPCCGLAAAGLGFALTAEPCSATVRAAPAGHVWSRASAAAAAAFKAAAAAAAVAHSMPACIATKR